LPAYFLKGAACEGPKKRDIYAFYPGFSRPSFPIPKHGFRTRLTRKTFTYDKHTPGGLMLSALSLPDGLAAMSDGTEIKAQPRKMDDDIPNFRIIAAEGDLF
jgi:hypothetical protein